MTHPLTNWLLDQMLAAGYPATPEEAQRIAAGFVGGGTVVWSGKADLRDILASLPARQSEEASRG